MPALHMRLEVNALLLDLPERGERKDLKSAAVGQYRAAPAGEFVKPAHLPDQLVAGAHMEVIGV